jgi:hypothetical protein
MPNPAKLSPSAVSLPAPELRAAILHEDASKRGDKVRCIVKRLGGRWTSDPLRWKPWVWPDGFYYPKQGDECSLAYPSDGPPYIAEWWPSDDAEPDAPLS